MNEGKGGRFDPCKPPCLFSSPRRRPLTMSSISRTVEFAAAASHASSVSTVATRVSSRTALYAMSPAVIAACVFGSASSASATRSRSRAVPGA